MFIYITNTKRERIEQVELNGKDLMDVPQIETSAFVLAAWSKVGMETGRYGSNSGPRA